MGSTRRNGIYFIWYFGNQDDRKGEISENNKMRSDFVDDWKQ